MVTYNESFTAADGPLTTADLTWIALDKSGQGGGSPVIVSNQMTSSGVNGMATMATAMPDTDMEISVTLKGTLNGSIYMMIRANNSPWDIESNCLTFAANSAGAWFIDLRVDGNYASIPGSSTEYLPSDLPRDGDVFTFGASGNLTYVKRNGVVIVSGTDSTADGLYCSIGLQQYGGALASLDNFSTTDQVNPPTLQFACPANANAIPPTLPDDTTSLSYRLFKHYRPRPEGINVYILSDDTVTENDPDGSSVLWAESDRMGDTIAGCPHVVRVFWGAHDGEEVTDDEAALLIDAGYTVTYA